MPASKKRQASTLHSLESCKTLDGKPMDLKDLQGKVVLVENVASMCGTTTRDYTQMNALVKQFGESLVVMGFPCNQFGHQENGKGEEILTSLKNIRPGNGFEPAFQLMEKCAVNGDKEHPLFTWLKEGLPCPSDEEAGSSVIMGNPQSIGWQPVKRSDVAWNFEKFLIGKDGRPIRRYSRRFLTADIAKDIEAAVKA